MERLLEGALADGALGLSTGLTYLPGTYSDVAELTRLCRVLTRHGAIHVSHMRGYDDQVEAGLAELVALADETGCRSHVSHLHGPASPMLDLVDDALRRGLEVTFDSYPYLRGSSILAAAALPTQLQENGPRETLARLADEDQVGWLRVNWFPAIRDTVLRRATVSHVGVAELRWVEGLSPWAAAEQVGADVGAFTCELLRRSRLDVGCVYGQASNTDDDVRAVLRHPMHMGGSDGIYLGARPHPRGWGTFARFLGRHTRALNDWHWGEAVRHLSTAPVRAFGLGDRGRVEPGAVADLAVIDPAVVADTATYERPRSPAIGVPIVLVAGQCVLRDGKLTGVVPGRALTRRASPRKGTG